MCARVRARVHQCTCACALLDVLLDVIKDERDDVGQGRRGERSSILLGES